MLVRPVSWTLSHSAWLAVGYRKLPEPLSEKLLALDWRSRRIAEYQSDEKNAKNGVKMRRSRRLAERHRKSYTESSFKEAMQNEAASSSTADRGRNGEEKPKRGVRKAQRQKATSVAENKEAKASVEAAEVGSSDGVHETKERKKATLTIGPTSDGVKDDKAKRKQKLKMGRSQKAATTTKNSERKVKGEETEGAEVGCSTDVEDAKAQNVTSQPKSKRRGTERTQPPKKTSSGENNKAAIKSDECEEVEVNCSSAEGEAKAEKETRAAASKRKRAKKEDDVSTGRGGSRPPSKKAAKSGKKSKGSEQSVEIDTGPATSEGAVVSLQQLREKKVDTALVQLFYEVFSSTLRDKILGCKKFIGAHVSAAGGVDNAPANAAAVGCRAFALFVRNQRTWNLAPVHTEVLDRFKRNLKLFGYEPKHVLPHGSYLLNAGAPDEETRRKTRETIAYEIRICQHLGLPLYNFHPGSSCGKITQEECLNFIAETINYIHDCTEDVTLVLETMSRQGYTVGGDFKEIRQIIDMVKDKSRVGVCLDTCHVFAAGYDIKTAKGYKKTMNEFDEIIGWKYLRGVHLNDSKGGRGCHVDRHENIGKGRIGLEGFRNFMNDPRFDDIPMVLETPYGDYAKEVERLYKLL